MNDNLLIIETTVETVQLAHEISAALVDKKLAACCHISSPITSIYVWEGEVCESSELKITIKSLPHHYEAIEALITRHHPYEVPEIIAYNSARSSQAYADWVKEVCHV